jgi:hypothetical protein
MLQLLVCIVLMIAKTENATIIDSGSTNRAGFRIEVGQSGVSEMTPAHRTITLPPAVVQRFYTDLEAAKPLKSLPEVHCMKSASFGSALTVAFGNDQTPDLSCGDGGNAAMRNLIRDVNEIVGLFNNE